MKWVEVCIHTTQEAIEIVSNLLHEHGASGVVIEDPEVLTRDWDTSLGEWYQLSSEDYPIHGVRVKGYISTDEEMDTVVEDIRHALVGLNAFGLDLGACEVSHVEVNEEDWANAWKQYYKPVKVTERITITPSWEIYDASDDELVIELDPGMAFGTGTHPTTVLCLKALDKTLKGGETVVDVGCGTGVLSIAAVKLGAKSALALDLDPVAVESAVRNTEMNHVSEQVRVAQNDLLKGISPLSVDIVVANILADVIVSFTSEVFDVLRPGGMYISSGIIKAKKELVRQAIESAGMVIQETIYDEDWVAFVSQKV